ncbi:MAG: FG-GAP repeat protein, partial [Ilumatobacter sp.]|nr:FG-GAP repeat protein [Ilumatobacter sp.]
MANPFDYLVESQPVDPSRINGVAPGALRIGADGDAVVTFRGEAAGYHNTVGVYLIGADGTLTDGRILFTDASFADHHHQNSRKLQGVEPLQIGDSVHLSAVYDGMDLQPDQAFGLFVVANGALRNKADRIERGDAIDLFDKSTGDVATLDTLGKKLVLESVESGKKLHGKVFMTADGSPDDAMANALNRDGDEHVISAPDDETGDTWLAFEDLKDNDFNDLLLSVSTQDETMPTANRIQLVELAEGRLTVFEGVPGDRLGGAVAGIGDANGDGIDDMLIGADTLGEGGLENTGAAFLIAGKDGGFMPVEPVADLVANFEASTIVSFSTNGRFGFAVGGAGDVDGDGFADFLVGGPEAGSEMQGTVELFLSSNGQFTIDGLMAGDDLGRSVNGAGDLNNDGFDDIVIGARLADVPIEGDEAAANAGKAYVLFGSATGVETDLSLLDGSNGFVVRGTDPIDQLGRNVAGLGDVNGDGIDDLGIAVPDADPMGVDAVRMENAGEAFVLFGRETGFAASIGSTDLDGTEGFRLIGGMAGDFAGYDIDGAGDVNGDGIGDILVGSFQATPGETPMAGAAYVVFGKDGGFDPVVDLSALDGSDGFVIPGLMSADATGQS